ncbi:hypothetical protein D9M70_567470 [compost metagenome]
MMASAWPSSCHSTWLMCGVMGASRRAIVSRPSWISARSSALACGAFSSTFIRVITAAMAVLNLWCWPISWLAWRMARWMARCTAFCSSFRALRSRAAGRPAATWPWARRQTRRRKRLAPSTPESDHSRLMSGGEANIMNRRQVSAP